MDIVTHLGINARLCGTPVSTAENESSVEMTTLPEMAVDDTGLVHGGFIFGLADHAAMIAVNHPNVVLGGAQVKFLKPVAVGEAVTAYASAGPLDGKKQVVTVTVERAGSSVFSGEFTCFVLPQHVLAGG